MYYCVYIIYIYMYVCIQTGIPMVTQGLHLFYTLQKKKTRTARCEENAKKMTQNTPAKDGERTC